MSRLLSKWSGRGIPERELLKPLEELNLSKDEWSKSVLTLVDEKDGGVQQPAKDPVKAYDCSFADVNKKVLQLSSEHGATHASAEGSVLNTLNALRTLNVDRESSRLRKAGTSTQRFLTNVGNFLQSFSGIAEVVKAADQQYGGLAYGTVMILTMVAVKKTEREELITDVLEELGYAFPRLDVLEHVAPRDSLRRLIVGAFELTIRFCRHATEYCVGRSWRRVLDASVKDEVLKTVSRLRIQLSEIRKECEIMMIQDLKEMREKLDLMDAKLDSQGIDISSSNILLRDVQTRGKNTHAIGEDTNIRVRENQAWMERRDRSKEQRAYLNDLKRSLELQTMVKTADALAKVDKLMVQLSDDQEHKSAESLSSEMLRKDRTFANWYGSSKSSVLVLGGHNLIADHEDDPDATSWLSYASSWITRDSIRKGDHTLSFFARLEEGTRSHQRQSFWYIIKTFIFNLAQTLPENLVDRQKETLSRYDKAGWNDADSVDAIEQMVKLLTALLSDLPQGSSVAIIVDRLDQCQWANFEVKGVDGMVHAVRFLVQLVHDASLRHLSVKVLLVLSAQSARNVGKRLSWAQDESFIVRADWDQEVEE